MQRIPELDPDTLSEDQKRVYDEIASGPRGGVRGPLAVWLRRPGLADRAQALGRYCRYDSSLSPRLSELAILTTARIWDAAYEWAAHVPHAEKAGLSKAVIDALKEDREPTFESEEEAVIYEVTRRLNLDRRLSDDLYQRAERVLGLERLVDLVGVLGYYSLISMTLNAFEIEVPAQFRTKT
ncbi:carboxymuconolactone decarboxylase family protein [Nisaea acidiphila]|uniref:Carboxymuconolactone decarboxylase family protein n=1 Tax=Nisaea acidiphila TaxID=1862145 RepID=A0A9J7AT68_9PROT|nr:carboxymuconolactone decarboxylase family protein [Nisaea acidiphila]UUX50883.1 carboxymuconolactone decarboxylase family protein [Nisaea acidiphila]